MRRKARPTGKAGAASMLSAWCRLKQARPSICGPPAGAIAGSHYHSALGALTPPIPPPYDGDWQP